jgi:hypothetical protein
MWTDLPTVALIGAFLASATVVFLSGLRMTGLADRLADRTGLGEAIVGGVLLGAATSLSGIIVSITAALDGRASLAFSNSVGGIAAQTVFPRVADMFYRKINLEHAAADLGNVFQGLVLMVLLTLPFVALDHARGHDLGGPSGLLRDPGSSMLVGLVAGRACTTPRCGSPSTPRTPRPTSPTRRTPRAGPRARRASSRPSAC